MNGGICDDFTGIVWMVSTLEYSLVNDRMKEEWLLDWVGEPLKYGVFY